MTALPKPCCGPARNSNADTLPSPALIVPGRLRAEGAVDIPGGASLIGTNAQHLPIDGEGPLRKTKVKPYRMGATAVTNAQFAAFVEETGYVTEAERFGWSFVFWAQVPKAIGNTQAVQEVKWWRRVDGANWRDINGPSTRDSTWAEDHPVVQVSWNDAMAYAAWAGGRLPTEAEWEHAARGGQGDVPFPWGAAEPDDTGTFPCNIWQGRFPDLNSGADGYATTAPVTAFEANPYGLYNMSGNAWEWLADSYRVKSLKRAAKERAAQMKGYKTLKGGSFLCHRSYCYRYRIAARSGNSPDSTTTHQGFRMVWDI